MKLRSAILNTMATTSSFATFGTEEEFESLLASLFWATMETFPVGDDITKEAHEKALKAIALHNFDEVVAFMDQHTDYIHFQCNVFWVPSKFQDLKQIWSVKYGGAYQVIVDPTEATKAIYARKDMTYVDSIPVLEKGFYFTWSQDAGEIGIKYREPEPEPEAKPVVVPESRLPSHMSTREMWDMIVRFKYNGDYAKADQMYKVFDSEEEKIEAIIKTWENLTECAHCHKRMTGAEIQADYGLCSKCLAIDPASVSPSSLKELVERMANMSSEEKKELFNTLNKEQ